MSSIHTRFMCIDKLWIDYDYVISDHLSGFVNIQLPSLVIVLLTYQIPVTPKVVIVKLTGASYQQMKLIATQKTVDRHAMSHIQIVHLFILCDGATCNDPSHLAAIVLV